MCSEPTRGDRGEVTVQSVVDFCQLNMVEMYGHAAGADNGRPI